MLATASWTDKDAMISLCTVRFYGIDACGSISNALWVFADEGTKKTRHIGEDDHHLEHFRSLLLCLASSWRRPRESLT